MLSWPDKRLLQYALDVVIVIRLIMYLLLFYYEYNVDGPGLFHSNRRPSRRPSALALPDGRTA